jgi:hypothetical protein
MNWITHLTVETILVSADVASVGLSAVFFSERVRRWISRKRWGSHPADSTLLYSVALAGMDDSSIGSKLPLPIATPRNPFAPRAREALANGAAPQAHRDEYRRPTFKRSTVLQQRIAAYKRALADFATAAPERRNETRIATPPIKGGSLNPSFERFAIGHLRESATLGTNVNFEIS